MLTKWCRAPAPELITNGTFDTDINGWTNIYPSFGGTVAWDSVNQSMKVTSASNYAGAASTSFTTVVGQNYVLNFNCLADTYPQLVGRVKVSVANSSSPGVALASVNVNAGAGSYQLPFTATATAMWVWVTIDNQATVQYINIDNVSVKKSG